jgi:transcription elongation factor SPT6
MSAVNRDEEDGVFDDDNDDDSEEQPSQEPPKKRKKIDKSTMIEDAAEESGDEGDDDEDDDDEENNDYVKDGFVVDEDDEDVKKKKDVLEDSDDDDDDDDDDDAEKGDNTGDSARKRLKKIRKMRQLDLLDDEDLALIQEAQRDDEEMPDRGPEPLERQRVVAKSEAELRKGLFYDSGDEDEREKAQQEKKLVVKAQVERFDEDGMDDFIDDDIGDQGDIMAQDRRGANDEKHGEVSEAQLNEASEIFGTDYLEFMASEQPDEEEEELMGKYRERGIDLGVDSEEEIMSDEDDDDDDDLFGDEDDEQMDSSTSQQKAESLRLKREKRNLAKAGRRRQALSRKTERRKAQLRRAFEPVQLVENFCTDRDDAIRQTDIPERLYDWKTPFHGSEDDGMTEEEKTEAVWIVGRIPDIMTEFVAASSNESLQDAILQSIANALRFMHRDKVEPAFIKRYRKDYVTSPSVQANLYAIMDEDSEWERVLNAREKLKILLQTISSMADGDASAGVDVQNLRQLQEGLQLAQEQLDETAKQESLVKAELEALGDVEDDDDDDDELFGDDDDGNGEVRCAEVPNE